MGNNLINNNMKVIVLILAFGLALSLTNDSYSLKAERVSMSQVDSVAADVINNNPVQEGEGYDWGWIVTIAIAILETVARLFPTKKNISIISLIVRLLNVILPNLKKKQKPQDKSKFEN